MKKPLPQGLQAELKKIVTAEMTAKAVGSGALEVYATPTMIALMEEAAADSVTPYLEAGETTVGTMISVKHLAATPVGVEVCAKSVLTEIDRRKLSFDIVVYDNQEKIGEAKHERFIVQAEPFMEKAAAKKQ